MIIVYNLTYKHTWILIFQWDHEVGILFPGMHSVVQAGKGSDKPFIQPKRINGFPCTLHFLYIYCLCGLLRIPGAVLSQAKIIIMLPLIKNKLQDFSMRLKFIHFLIYSFIHINIFLKHFNPAFPHGSRQLKILV